MIDTLRLGVFFNKRGVLLELKPEQEYAIILKTPVKGNGLLMRKVVCFIAI